MSNYIAYDDKIAGGSTPGTASNISYDNTDSGLTSTNTQDAIDELSSNILVIEQNLTSAISLEAGEERDISINFTKTFSARPGVTVTIFCAYGYPSYLAGTLKYVNDTGFTYCIKNSSESTVSVRLMWIAAL